jgi:thioredoxin 1
MIEVTDATFEAEVRKPQGDWDLVVVDIYTDTCAPCKALEPFMQAIEGNFERVKVCRLDAKTNPETLVAHAISGVPTVLVFKGGQCLKKLVGPKGRDVEHLVGYYT